MGGRRTAVWLLNCLMLQCSPSEQSCPQLTRKPRLNWQTGGKWTNSHYLLLHYRHKCRVLFHWLCCFECENDTTFLRAEAECLSMNSYRKIKELILLALFPITLPLGQTLLEISPLWCHRGYFVKEGETTYVNNKKTLPFWCLSLYNHLTATFCLYAVPNM